MLHADRLVALLTILLPDCRIKTLSKMGWAARSGTRLRAVCRVDGEETVVQLWSAGKYPIGNLVSDSLFRVVAVSI